jgi:hypothetical protein
MAEFIGFGSRRETYPLWNAPNNPNAGDLGVAAYPR